MPSDIFPLPYFMYCWPTSSSRRAIQRSYERQHLVSTANACLKSLNDLCPRDSNFPWIYLPSQTEPSLPQQRVRDYVLDSAKLFRCRLHGGRTPAGPDDDL